MTTTNDNKSKPRKVKTTSKRESGAKQSIARTLILDAAEKLIREEGYAAVSTRRVAKDAGLKAPLVHYYFATTDDLFLAVFRRAVEGQLEKLDDAGSSEQSLQTIWSYYKNADQTALALEFMALANHRKAIRSEIAQYTERARQRRAEVLARHMAIDSIQPGCSAAGMAVLMIGVARTLVMEQGLGITLGHDDANAFVEWWLERLQKRTD